MRHYRTCAAAVWPATTVSATESTTARMVGMERFARTL